MSAVVDISGLSKASVFAALYNAAKPQGMGFLQYDPAPMTEAEVEAELSYGPYFDYVRGRVMKIDLSGDVISPHLYDRDNGAGAAAHVIASLRASRSAQNAVTETMHHINTRESALSARDAITEKTTIESGSGVAVVTLGLSDVASELSPKLNQVIGSD